MTLLVERAYVVPEPDDFDLWPFSLPPVRQLCSEGISFSRPVTMLVGENGSGKSTLIEALAEASGIDVRGGHGGRRYATDQRKGPLGSRLQLETPPRSKLKAGAGFFLRAETALGVFEFMSDHEVPGYGERHLARVSHGEGYLQVLTERFTRRALYLLDEPEAPLSFQSCLALIRVLVDVVDLGAQVICATHSPVLAALPDAELLEIGDHGIRPIAWEDLEVVSHLRRYLKEPGSYLRHLLA